MSKIKQLIDGGNKEFYGELAEVTNADDCCDEFTWRSFKSENGQEFVAL